MGVNDRRRKTLEQWLSWQETLHPTEIEFGLERCGEVAARMGWPVPPFSIFTVAGTNGKGSSVVMLEAILLAAGYRTGVYISPHIRRYNERIRLNGAEVTDQALCQAFQRIERVRGGISLTYFEFGTLAAMDIFHAQNPDVVVLEVGLGGRLDAVNLFPSAASLITTVGIDHIGWLGADRESIGREKAGIFCRDRPAVCADSEPPDSIRQAAKERGSRFLCADRDFRCLPGENGWTWRAGNTVYRDLPLPRLRGEFQLRNAAGVLMLLRSVEDRLPVPENALREGLKSGYLPGRLEVLPGPVEWILDVAHNPQAAEALTTFLGRRKCEGRTHALLGLLADKDVEGVVSPLTPVDAWHVVGLPTKRSAKVNTVAQVIKRVHCRAKVNLYPNIKMAQMELESVTEHGDRVVVFGSFYTVAQVLKDHPETVI